MDGRSADPAAAQIAAVTRGLPAPAELRTLSGLTETLLPGKFTLLRSSGALDNGTALDLVSSGGMEWGLYGFDPQGNAPDSVSVALDVSAGDGAWIGLADYDKGSWEWHGPFSSGKTLAIDEARYLSPGGLLYCTVAASDGDSATVNALSIRSINPQNLAPVADLQADVLSGDAPLSVAFDASGSSDTDGQIIEYAWDWDGNLQYEELTDQPLASHTFTNAGLRTVNVRVTDEQFARATDSVDIDVNLLGNAAPVADLSAIPQDVGGKAPLIVDFDATGSSDSDGALLRYDWDFDGDLIWEAYDGPPVYAYTYTEPGLYTARLRVTDDAGAQSIDTASIEVFAGGNAPTAAVEFTGVTFGYAPHMVTYDASTSDSGDSPEESIVLYEWDWDANGSYDESGPEAIIEHTFSNVGVYAPVLRVTDEAGNQDAISADPFSVYISPVSVDATGAGSVGTSMLVVLGNPAIAYYSADNDELLYRLALDDAGSQWSDAFTIDTTGNVGLAVSLKIVNNNPAVAYYDVTNTQLLFARSSTLSGNAWNPPVVVDNSGDSGKDLALGTANGLPCVAFTVDTDLYYAQASNLNGSAWNAAVLIDASGTAGTEVALAIVNGFPAVSYWDSAGDELRYARALDIDGAGWDTPVLIDASGTDGFGGGLAIVNGRPAVCYHPTIPSELRFARALDADGAAWGTAVLVDDAAGDGAGGFCTMIIVNGNPAIGYVTGGQVTPAYVRANDRDGVTWAQPQKLGPASFQGYYTNLVLANGRPAICSRTSNFGELLYYWGF